MNKLRDMGADLIRWGYRHQKWAFVLILVPLTWWASDRSPPFEVVRYYEPPAVTAGAEVTFSMVVDRELGRDCSATVSRQLRDSSGTTRPVTAGEYFSAKQIAAIEHEAPDMLKRTFVVPPTLAPGRAVLITETQYRCGLNPFHALWPIDQLLEWPFEVLPAKATPPMVIIDRRDSR
jgi:hypothetical protein